MNVLRTLFCCLICLLGILLSPTVPAQTSYTLPATEAADFPGILNNRSEQAKVFTYGSRGLIRIIDFPDLQTQGRMFNRVVALIERTGAPRSRVMDNDELIQFIRSVGKSETTFAYGNDFLISELVVFFNLADMAGIRLHAEEIALRRMLLESRLIVERQGFFQALKPQAVILSIPQESTGGNGPSVSALARKTILMHELSHGEYYTNPLYANYCRSFWRKVMNEAQRAAFRQFLSGSSYNPDNEEMMINETQAYLMYTPDPRAFNARMLGLREKEIDGLRAQFLNGFPDAPMAEMLR